MTKQIYFTHANKPGRWLAHKLKKENIQLIDDQRQICYGSKEKKEIIRDYYGKLYTQENIDDERVKQYLQNANLPQIPKEIEIMLESNITMMELTEALKKQNNGKAPGPDGLPAEFYKTLQESLNLPLLEVMNEVMSKKMIPKSWSEAYITLIPKEEADALQIKNYRPISLLNADYKIFASILAERLKKYLNNFIHSDQNGFLPKRQIKDNMRVIIGHFGILREGIDNVNWRFMLLQLEQMGFGKKFIQAIEAIYHKQTAKVMIEGELTDSIDIRKGTRQGCPLSPLLFVLTLEVLNRNIRDEKNIKGMKIKKEEFKQKEELADVLKIQVTNKIKYLGIYLTARCSTLKENNYIKLKQQIALDLMKWENLQLSLTGRISTVKMNILPRIL
uniref:Reverse transcriptase domain-containing protein n=1 Tax=Pseudonaja textilis TaxID=8673 RepID=A0A670XQU1_PSETE